MWLYTPPQAFGLSSYGSPTASPTAVGGRSPTMSPLQQNVDLGGNALREAANLCFGIASTIGATILLMRAGTFLCCFSYFVEIIRLYYHSKLSSYFLHYYHHSLQHRDQPSSYMQI